MANEDTELHSRGNVLVTMLLALIGMSAVAVVAMIVLFNMLPGPQYFEHRADGTVTELYALDVPVVGVPELLKWANQAAIECYTFGFNDYEEAFENARQYFTPNGWDSFQAALIKSKLLTTVTEKQLKLSAVTIGAPVVINQGFIFGNYFWKIQMPLLVSYESGSETKGNKYVITLTVARVSTRDVAKGIAITEFYSAPLGGSVGGLG